ncbi:MAG: formate dehydrogenase subunit alpha [Deltaproteobacteria bacterium RIFOXYB2_FULL_66_7]|nr:MAG: formate dehydrogenase subunit alpha [Deltaproteobacteria bacterium RIFOXYB2_FULL_66_7]
MDGKLTLLIDGIEVKAQSGATVLRAALGNGIYIPHLCDHPDLGPAGVCRLCLVRIEGRGLTPSCRTPVEPGMVVNTSGPEIDAVRRVATELLIADHHGDCLSCSANAHCELQRVAAYVGIEPERLGRLRRTARTLPLDTSNPFFDRDPNRCVLCGICVRTCDQLQGVGAIDLAFRGYDTVVSTFGNWPIVESRCESCGECVVRCPVGALTFKGFREPTREVRTVCPYCGCGCGLQLGVRAGRVVSVRGDSASPVNRGTLCVKGRFGQEFIHHPERLTTPLMRKDGQLVPVTWDEAFQWIAREFSARRGAGFAAISSAKCSNEENYLVQKLARAVMGTNHIDHCARLCHAPSVAGLAQSLGSGAMTNSIEEIAGAACILAVGTNTTAAHPLIGLQVRRAAQRGAKLIVINPKQIDLCQHAAIFLQPRPGTDVPLLSGMMRVIVEEALYDAAFVASRCEEFASLKESLARFPLDLVERITGVPREKIAEAARCYATHRPAAILYAMGVTQHSHGTDNVLATSNLALLTGNLGRPSSGVNPLRGQNNVQGACDMGALPNVFPGYQRVNDEAMRRKFQSAWRCELNGTPGLTHTEIFDAILDGRIEALYLVGENPVLSEANSSHVEEALGHLPVLVVQDIFLTETARLAHVVLPAVTFAEKDGTFTNTERRVQRVRKAVEPVGQSQPDWWITCQIAQHLGAAGFDFIHPSQVMEEIASLVPSYAGISYERLEHETLQWPCPTREHPGTPILHTERFATASGKAKFVPLEYRESAELPDETYPLILTTDRSLFHFHTSTMTRRVKGLNRLNREELLRLHPADARRLGIADGEMVEVHSRRGKVQVRAKLSDACPPGVVSATFHFAESPINVLTNCALDPVAKIPETKVCAVRIEKLNGRISP